MLKARLKAFRPAAIRRTISCRGAEKRWFTMTAVQRWGPVPEWASDEAKTALTGFRQRFSDDAGCSSACVSEMRQLIDANQIHLARITQAAMLPLGRSSDEEEAILTGEEAQRSGVLQNGIAARSEIIPGEHLAFFTPRVASSTLGADGSDTSFNPPGGVFTRRMWAGGEMTFPTSSSDDALRVTDVAWERTYVEDAQLKRLRSGNGGEMIVVWVRKEIGRAGEEAPLIVDRRSWVFQPAIKSDVQASTIPMPESEALAAIRQKHASPPRESLLHPTLLCQSAADLFRYSALTFNAHAIHLSYVWAHSIEGQQNIVVHGPLNLSLLLRKWGSVKAGWRIEQDGRFTCVGRRLVKVAYRAKRPVYAGKPYWIGIVEKEEVQDDSGQGGQGSPKHQEQHLVVAMHPDGQVAMEATITSELM